MNHPYAKDPSNQMQLDLPGFTDGGAELMEDARKWYMRHRFAEWDYYVQVAREESDRTHGKASPNWCLQSVRRRFAIKIPNEYAAPLARICKEKHPEIGFRLGKSKTDGFANARL